MPFTSILLGPCSRNILHDLLSAKSASNPSVLLPMYLTVLHALKEHAVSGPKYKYYLPFRCLFLHISFQNYLGYTGTSILQACQQKHDLAVDITCVFLYAQ